MSDFTLAVNVTLQHEGGYQRMVKDSGNWTGGDVGVGELKGTNMGISAAQFPQLNIQDLTLQEARIIYEQKYWNPLYVQIKDQGICNKLFDLGVLFGPGTAIKILQECLSQFDIVPDAQFGPKTLEAVNASEPTSLLVAYKTLMVARAIKLGAQDPNMRDSVGPWIRRINS